METLEPWFADSSPILLDEFRREVPPGHVLEAVELSPLAHRKDRDEAAYTINDGSGRFAIVHLTLCKTRESDPKWPRTWIFKSPEAWNEYLEAAHAAWVEEDLDGQLYLKEQRLLKAAKAN